MHNTYLVLGKVSGVFGVAGWIRVFSYTRPRDNIFHYPVWRIGNRDYTLEQSQRQAKGLVAKLQGLDDRDEARSLMGQEIRVERQALPETDEGEYYWADLIGLRVRHQVTEFDFGEVTGLLETGSNDVLVVQGEVERLIPFIRQQVIGRVDLQAGIIWVDWDPEF